MPAPEGGLSVPSVVRLQEVQDLQDLTVLQDPYLQADQGVGPLQTVFIPTSILDTTRSKTVFVQLLKIVYMKFILYLT